MGRGMSSLFFRTLLILAFILVISIAVLQNKTKTITAIAGDDPRQSRTSTTAAETLRQQEEQANVLGKGKSSVADLNYMSKRRVPNGPDPIHNRRAGNSGRPPGRA